MEELKKVRRVAERPPGLVNEVLLVIDATTGQNGLIQAREFAAATGVTGVVLTKLDGTAKGGIALAIAPSSGSPSSWSASESSPRTWSISTPWSSWTPSSPPRRRRRRAPARVGGAGPDPEVPGPCAHKWTSVQPVAACLSKSEVERPGGGGVCPSAPSACRRGVGAGGRPSLTISSGRGTADVR